MMNVGLSSTSDVITLDQNWHHLYSTSAGGKNLFNDAQISVISQMDPKICTKMLKKLSYHRVIAAAKNIKLKHVIDPEDVAEVMLSLIHDKASRHNYKEVPGEEDSEELDEQPEQATVLTPTTFPSASAIQELPSKTKDAEQQPTATPIAHHQLQSGSNSNSLLLQQ